MVLPAVAAATRLQAARIEKEMSMNSLFAASIFAGLVVISPVMAQTNTGPSPRK